MSYEELKMKMKEILDVVKECPENLQEKCFEILMNAYISKSLIETPSSEEKIGAVSPSQPILQIDVRAFLTQYTIPEDKIQKLFFIHGNEIRPIYKIETTQKAKAQIQIALLSALENALKTSPSKFEFSIEDVREKCANHKCYDITNFTTHFKNNSKLYKSLTDKEHVELSPDGKQELAETILAVAK